MTQRKMLFIRKVFEHEQRRKSTKYIQRGNGITNQKTENEQKNIPARTRMKINFYPPNYSLFSLFFISFPTLIRLEHAVYSEYVFLYILFQFDYLHTKQFPFILFDIKKEYKLTSFRVGMNRILFTRMSLSLLCNPPIN